jgi:RNA polymerase sigma factor (sigma-70 family)
MQGRLAAHESRFMKIVDPGAQTLREATAGDLAALDRLLLLVQPGIFNLALRMLGQREDAADATQEILLKVVTHLSSFRAEAAFPTWVYQIARNHLLTAATRQAESPEVSLEGMAERLQAGLDFVTTQGQNQGLPAILTPQDKAEARQVALGCTQNMLMALDREQRLIYVLDTVFDLPSKVAAEVVGVSPAAYRQRLSRARAKLETFAIATCGLVNEKANCHCEKQLPALRQERASLNAHALTKPGIAMAIHNAERADAERQLATLLRLGDVAAVFRAHPQYQAPGAMLGAIRAVLGAEGFLDARPLQ